MYKQTEGRIFEMPTLPPDWEAAKAKAEKQIRTEGSLCGVGPDGEIDFRLVYVEPFTAPGWDYCVCFLEDTKEVIPVVATENIITEDYVGGIMIFRFIAEDPRAILN
jgi:hypothetical protein